MGYQLQLGIIVDLYNITHFDPAQPNPGIGGTQYMSLSLAHLLSSEFPVTIFTNARIEFPGVSIKPREAIQSLTEDDILIVSVVNFDNNVDKCKAKVIAWAHNMRDTRLDKLASRATRLVVISPPQYDLLRWHKIRSKMCTIAYPFDPAVFTFQATSDDSIVYLGALVKPKGFHHYAKALPRFLKGRKTKLYVIGGSQTYGEEGTGRLKVTSAEYEEKFWESVKPFLESGQVEFLGNLGAERFELIAKAKLALTNPTGSSETFCISNYECMSLGVPVIGGYHKGMTETLYPDKRLHIHRTGQIGTKISKLLDNPELLQSLRPKVRAFVERKADSKRIQAEWHNAINDVPVRTECLSRPYLADNKIPIWLLSKMTSGFSFAQVEELQRKIDKLNMRIKEHWWQAIRRN